MRISIKPISVVLSVLFLGMHWSSSYAESEKVKACYVQKDKACLESLYDGLVSEPTPEKHEAVYYLGMLYLEEGDYESAKSQFQLSFMFKGGDPRSEERFVEVIKSGKVEIDAHDCNAIQSEECFLQVADDNPEKADVAYYHLARFLSGSDSQRAADYAIKAAELGHGTSECLVAFGYAHEKVSGPSVMASFTPDLPLDYEKSREWFEKCDGGPFYGYNDEHFKKYELAKNHKAYARLSYKIKQFSDGYATPEIAAYITAAICDARMKQKSEKDGKQESNNERCQIVSVDGEWVDYFSPEKPALEKGVDSLLRAKARESYAKYESTDKAKVFAQGPLGNWSWHSIKEGESIDALKKRAIDSCQDSWRYEEYGSACKVINESGVWLTTE